MFGEVADQYDAARPSYPDALFATVIELRRTRARRRRARDRRGNRQGDDGIRRPRSRRARARAQRRRWPACCAPRACPVEVTRFEEWPVRAARVPVGVRGAGVALGAGRRSLRKGRRGTGARRHARAVLERRARAPGAVQDRQRRGVRTARARPHRLGRRQVDRARSLVGDAAACGAFEPMVERKITWRTSYTSAEWMRLLGTHSNHRMLPDDGRARNSTPRSAP